MAERPGFDMSRLTMGQKGLLITGGLLFIDFFLPWRVVSNCPPGLDCGSQSGLAGIGWLGFIFVIGILVWEGALIANVRVNTGTVSPALISAAFGAGVVIFTLIRFLMSLGGGGFGIDLGPGFGAWIGIVLTAALAYATWVRYQESRVTAGGAPQAPPPPPPAP